jgi:hypothetical protein
MAEYSEDSAKGQLLRADHLFHVTLKYTRTVDVIRNTIKRLIIAFDFAFEEVLTKRKKEIPELKIPQARKVEELYAKDKQVKEIVDFYFYLKKLIKNEYKAREEYRKNVTLIVEDVDEINIDKLHKLYDQTRENITYLEEL